MKRAVKFLLEHGAAGLLLDPGLRKTSITLGAISLLLKKKVASKVLVIAPLRVAYSTWPGEVAKWKDFNHLRVVVLHGPKKDELLKTEADIYVINPEGLDWLLDVTKTTGTSGKKVVIVDLKRFKRLGFDTLVVDELTKFKNHNSDRFKAMKCVLGTFRRRWGLTGSPAANGLLPLFGQMFMLDQGNSLGAYITHYRAKYFLPAVDGFNWKLAEGSEQKIYEAINPLALRMAAEDYLDMPQIIVNNIRVDLDDKAREIYDAVEDDLFASLETGVVVAKNSGVALGKCRQVASGGVFLTPEVEALVRPRKGEREWSLVHDEKIEAIKDLVEELQGQPCLIAYEFEHDLIRLRKAFPEATFVVDVPAKDFKRLEDRWNRGEIGQLISHPAAVSHGLNLQKSGKHVIWFTLTWDYEVYDQFIRRLRRGGTVNKCIFVHHILATRTVDEYVLVSLDKKSKGQQSLFDALKLMRGRRR